MTDMRERLIELIRQEQSCSFDERAINISIFLTREEAERALKERSSDHA